MSSRDRYDGSSDAMAAEFEHVARKEPCGKKMIAYPTSGTVKLSKLHLKPMKNCRRWVHAALKLHDKMNFAKSVTKSAFKVIFRRHHKRWKLLATAESKFAEKMQIRLRTVCHQFARGRRHDAQWAADILGDGGEEEIEDEGNDAGCEEEEEEDKDEEEEVASAAEEEVAPVLKKPASAAKKPAEEEVAVVVAKKPAAAEAFFYGWNVELQCGYRCRAVEGKAKDGEEEMACPIEEKPPDGEAADLDEYIAHF